MTLLKPLILSLTLLSAFACSNIEHNTSAQPKVANTTPVPAPDSEQFPDIQTLSDGHQILLIRVAGDLSKVSPATKTKVETLKAAFNTAFEEFKTAIEQRYALLTKLKNLVAGQAAGAKKTSEQEETAKALEAATAAAEKAQEKYQELSRQFAVLIETVKRERAKQ